MNSQGKVYLVGAGPGDPGLITEKGKRLLEICDVVIYDRLVSPKLLSYTKTGCEKIYVGKEVNKHAIKQEEINLILVNKARMAPIVVRLKGGDPYVFGRGGEEVLTLKEHGIDYEVIPGITSSIAAATYAGIPITHRGTSQSFHVITGHTALEDNTVPEELKSLAKLNGTIVILMGLGNLNIIRDQLLEHGRPKESPVAIIENATTLWQREVRGTLEDICQKALQEQIKAPAVIIIGDVAGIDLRSDVRGALAGIRIGITGTKAITDKLAESLEEFDAKVDAISTSSVVEFENNTSFEAALKTLKKYQWIIFTSTNSVQIFFKRMKELHIDFRTLAEIKFAVVGTGTAKALEQQGFQADFLPEQYTVTCLASQLSSRLSIGDKILIPRAQQGSDELIHILNAENVSFDDIKIYDIEEAMDDTKEWLDRINSFNYLTFASSSGVHGFMKVLPKNIVEQLDKTKIVCIGEATERTLRDYGIDNILVANEVSVAGIVQRILEDHNHNGNVY